MAAPSRSLAVPPCVFSALSELSGPVAVVGSRELSVPALSAIARFGRWLGRKRRPLWSGGALGADSAASAGALAQGGAVRWWLPAAFAQLSVGVSRSGCARACRVLPAVCAPHAGPFRLLCALGGWACQPAVSRPAVPAHALAAALASGRGSGRSSGLHRAAGAPVAQGGLLVLGPGGAPAGVRTGAVALRGGGWGFRVPGGSPGGGAALLSAACAAAAFPGVGAGHPSAGPQLVALSGCGSRQSARGALQLANGVRAAVAGVLAGALLPAVGPPGPVWHASLRI